MGDEIRLIKWQYGPEEAQLVKLAESLERRLADTVKRNRERRVVAKYAKKNELMILDYVHNLGARKQRGAERVAANKTLFSPDRNETAVVTTDCCVDPVGILAAFSVAIDEGAREYIVVG